MEACKTLLFTSSADALFVVSVSSYENIPCHLSGVALVWLHLLPQIVGPSLLWDSNLGQETYKVSLCQKAFNFLFSSNLSAGCFWISWCISLLPGFMLPEAWVSSLFLMAGTGSVPFLSLLLFWSWLLTIPDPWCWLPWNRVQKLS